MNPLIESELNSGIRVRKRSEEDVTSSEYPANFDTIEAKRKKLPSIDMINQSENLTTSFGINQHGVDMRLLGGVNDNNIYEDDDSIASEDDEPTAILHQGLAPVMRQTVPKFLPQYEPEQTNKTPRKSRAKPQSEIIGRVRWTEDLDARLKLAVEMHGNQWKEVSAAVGFDKNPTQCFKRWTWFVNPALEVKKTGPWTEDEIDLMKTLVEHNNIRQTARGPKEAINWSFISKELNRHYYDCKNKHKLLLAAEMKKGPFSQEEDEIILERIQEWGNKGNGLWVNLEKELNRRADTIKTRAIKNRYITPTVPANKQQQTQMQVQQDLMQQQQQTLAQIHALQQQQHQQQQQAVQASQLQQLQQQQQQHQQIQQAQVQDFDL